MAKKAKKNVKNGGARRADEKNASVAEKEEKDQPNDSNTLSLADMRPFAKKLNIELKGKTADAVKEKILDRIEEEVAKAKAEKRGKIWAKENAELVEFYDKFVSTEQTSKDDLDKAKAELEKKKSEVSERATKERVTKDKKRKERAEKKPKKEKASKVELTSFGHRKDSSRGFIDEYLVAGVTAEKMSQALLKAYPDRYKDKAAALKRFEAYLGLLEKEGEVSVVEKKGVFTGKMKKS